MMRLNSAQRWLRRRRDWIISSLIGAVRLVEANDVVERPNRLDLPADSRCAPSWLLLGSVVFDVAWLAAWLVVSMRYHAPLAILPASFPLLKWSLLLVACVPTESDRSGQPVSLAAPGHSPSFRPSSTNDQRADADYLRSRHRGLADPEMAPHPRARLARNLSGGDGWKYRVVGGWLPPRRTVSPFGTVPDWWKVYQIAVEDPRGLVAYGWVRLRENKVEFHLDADRPQRDPVLSRARAGQPDREFSPDLMPVLAVSHPLVQPTA